MVKTSSFKPQLQHVHSSHATENVHDYLAKARNIDVVLVETVRSFGPTHSRFLQWAEGA